MSSPTTPPELPKSPQGISTHEVSSEKGGADGLAHALAVQYTEYEKQLTVPAALRKYWRCTLWVLYGQLVIFGYGIDANIAANLVAVPEFALAYGEYNPRAQSPVPYIIPATWLSLFNGISQLTAIIGALGTGWLSDRIGRRYTNLLACIISIGGVGAQYGSNGSLGILLAGKAINGFAVGSWVCLGPLYASEVSPLPLRGILTSTANVIQLFGAILLTGVTYKLATQLNKTAYLTLFGLQWIMPTLIILTIYFWPESPVWLMRRGRVDDARKALDQLHGRGPSINKEGILAQIQRTILEEQTPVGRYSDCFSKEHRQRTFICMFVYACQYCSGLVLVLGYQAYYYELIGFSTHRSFLFSLINYACQFVAIVLSWYILSYIGRRPLIVWGQAAGTLFLIAIGVASAIATKKAYDAAVAFIFIWAFTYMLGLGTAAWAVAAEIPPLKLRSRTQALVNITSCFFQWLIGFVFPYMFNPDAGNLGGKVAFVFAGTTFIGFVGVFFFLPETKGRSAAELDALYSMGVNPRKFSSTRIDLDMLGREDAEA